LAAHHAQLGQQRRLGERRALAAGGDPHRRLVVPLDPVERADQLADHHLHRGDQLTHQRRVLAVDVAEATDRVDVAGEGDQLLLGDRGLEVLRCHRRLLVYTAKAAPPSL
jgi:hypothetical protein